MLDGFHQDLHQLILASILLFKYRAAVEKGLLTDKQHASLRVDVSRVFGEVAKKPVLFDRDASLPVRSWQHAIGSVDTLPAIMVRSLHCVWKVLLQLCKESARKGVGLWIDVEGTCIKIENAVVKKFMQDHLNKLLSNSKAGKGLNAEELITRKVAVQILDAFMSPPIMPFICYSYKAIIMLGRIVGRLYSCVGFDWLPTEYSLQPAVLYGVYTLVYASMHCCMLYSDPTVKSKRIYLQDLVGHGMQQVWLCPIGLVPSVQCINVHVFFGQCRLLQQTCPLERLVRTRVNRVLVS